MCADFITLWVAESSGPSYPQPHTYTVGSSTGEKKGPMDLRHGFLVPVTNSVLPAWGKPGISAAVSSRHSYSPRCETPGGPGGGQSSEHLGIKKKGR